uniref:Uncharacterized protein n=1 Tax=Daphnia galeata TaxID=27404 RepID=A0A8J2RJ07_9CRUS|nr:unnamed protein product [Daphnia galeata]
MGLASYVTPYQAQKKWNNLWSKYKLAKRAQTEGPVEEDPNGAWPFFTVLDAIATGKTVAITSTPGVTLTVSDESSEPAVIRNNTAHHSTINASAIQVNDAEPPSKKSKLESEIMGNSSSNPLQWNGESEDHSKQQIVELLQANLQQLDEVRQSIESQGQAIVSMLSQLINVISCGNKSHTPNNSGTSRIDEAISATIREIGIPQENV